MLALSAIPLLLLSCIGVSHAAIEKDEITNLPGLTFTPQFKSYSGYLKATGTKKLHYWCVIANSTHKRICKLREWLENIGVWGLG